MSKSLGSLNKNQREAVEFDKGPLLVLAGPGSGKTHVLTLRVARLIEQDQDNAVLALTFTNKAATEMRDRVTALLHRSASRAHFCTFRKFALDLLRQHASHLGLRPDFTLLTREADRMAILRDAVAKLNGPHIRLPPDRRGVLKVMDRLFMDNFDGDSGSSLLARIPSWVPDLFALYCSELLHANQMDFPGLLYYSCRLLNTRPVIRRMMHIAWNHVCVDEFQDTSKVQYALLRLIVRDEKPNLFVAADDDQILYRWNGASPKHLRDLIRDFDMRVIQLPDSYRCPKDIVHLANSLIARNQDRYPDKKRTESRATASGRGDDVVRCRVFANTRRELSWVAKDIKKRQLRPSTCAALARNRRLVLRVAESLEKEGIKSHVTQRNCDWESSIIRVMFDALQLANSPHDREFLRRLCVDWERLTGRSTEVEYVVGGAALLGGDFLRAWVEAAMKNASGRDADLIVETNSSLVERRDFPGVVKRFLDGGVEPWNDDADQTLTSELSMLRELTEELITNESEITLRAYLDEFALAPRATGYKPNAIRCLTIHQAKGLGFGHVYLVGMTQNTLPTYYAIKARPKSGAMEEERRACFVAITRARESLTLTCAKMPNGKSQFLHEMGLHPCIGET